MNERKRSMTCTGADNRNIQATIDNGIIPMYNAVIHPYNKREIVTSRNLWIINFMEIIKWWKNDSEETLSEDGREIKGIAENFAAAYFSGDTDTIQSCLTSPYEWDIEVYEGLDTTGAGTISELTLKGLTNIGQEETGSIQVISLEFKDSHFEDMFIYLTIEFVKQEDGWKIQFYGLEG